MKDAIVARARVTRGYAGMLFHTYPPSLSWACNRRGGGGMDCEKAKEQEANPVSRCVPTLDLAPDFTDALLIGSSQVSETVQSRPRVWVDSRNEKKMCIVSRMSE